MSYKILSVANSEQLLIRDADDEANALYITDMRDLLRLRARLNAYVDTLEADGQLEAAPLPPGEMITTVQARNEAAEQGTPIEESTLRMAIVRGVITGAEKRGGRWWLPRNEFQAWLQGHIHRK